ncbi:hypothetical protein CR513_18303, partial [Mucuna pruriens]
MPLCMFGDYTQLWFMLMETQSCDAKPLVKATFRLGSESYSVEANKGSLSEQLVSLKEESMTILKDFITKHNVPHDVPDESLEASSDDDEDIAENPQLKERSMTLSTKVTRHPKPLESKVPTTWHQPYY